MPGDERGTEDVQPAALQQRADCLQVRVRCPDLGSLTRRTGGCCGWKGVLAGSGNRKDLSRTGAS